MYKISPLYSASQKIMSMFIEQFEGILHSLLQSPQRWPG